MCMRFKKVQFSEKVISIFPSIAKTAQEHVKCKHQNLANILKKGID